VNGLSYLYTCKTKESVLFFIENGIDINSVSSEEDQWETFLDHLHNVHERKSGDQQSHEEGIPYKGQAERLETIRSYCFIRGQTL